ncbi:ABC transporter permease [Lysinibacillus endophyticus]|uniref:ABC transporter permease n=1 Tax=Ureibacillus endophyticus TaxID=1978490 RepID=UPI00209D0132|nr:ABC transporter permease subunit [Lysinibacillus endophyticus]MCP1144848.1 ABC transporter permease [Lysinibacillus endophyticus]
MSTQMILLEYKQLLRSRWIQIVTILFAIVFTAILMIQHLAMPDTTGFTRQTASLLNILLFLLPLFMLTIGSMNIASDKESGWLGLLRTYPLNMGNYVLTKYIAFCLVFSGIFLFVVTIAFFVGSFFGGINLPLFAIGITAIIIFIFNALSIFVGSIAKSRLHALALGLGVWSVVTLVWNYIVMAIGTITAEHVLQKIVILSIHMNPLEWIRYGYFVFSKQTAVLGPAFYGVSKFYTSFVGFLFFLFVSLMWIVFSLLGAKIILTIRGKRG